ncbi:hypothetical protein OHA21_18045 [Actinoplanes sp. NBC_00393]|uniref:hypothetical protein n=1 Tax=Actinoplanes sp. NBC_00393 TaxID=2975953 RepID=UPI002E1B65E3
MSADKLFKRLRKVTLMDQATGAAAVKALRRQMAEHETPAAVWPDEHRAATRRRRLR